MGEVAAFHEHVSVCGGLHAVFLHAHTWKTVSTPWRPPGRLRPIQHTISGAKRNGPLSQRRHFWRLELSKTPPPLICDASSDPSPALISATPKGGGCWGLVLASAPLCLQVRFQVQQGPDIAHSPETERPRHRHSLWCEIYSWIYESVTF